MLGHHANEVHIANFWFKNVDSRMQALFKYVHQETPAAKCRCESRQ